MSSNDTSTGCGSRSTDLMNYLSLKNILDEKIAKATKLERKLTKLNKRITAKAAELKRLQEQIDRDASSYTNTGNEYKLLVDEITKLKAGFDKLGTQLLPDDAEDIDEF